MKHKRFEENILIDEAYTNYGALDKNVDEKKTQGIAKNFAESIEFDEKRKWYHQLPEEPVSATKEVSETQIEELKREASSALHGDTVAYETKSNKAGSSDHQWARTLLNKGAVGDRVAAATILIQENPLYNLNALRNLINCVKPAKKKDGIVIIDALSELLVSDLLIPDVKLRSFQQHSLGNLEEMTSGNRNAKRNILKLWYFEDQLKELYGTYVEALNKFAHDSVDTNKQKAVSAMSYLLMHHPEKEKMLLTNIVNKLGDPTQTVASKAIYHLCQLLYNHPNMKAVVLVEIEKMLFRSNISPRAQYYGICFLNQFYLGKDDSGIAENLIRIYFSFFKAAIKKGDIDSRLMSAILTGVKRAYPFADKDRIADTPSHIDAIHKLVHLARLNIAVHALALLYHISDASGNTANRYYTALYRKLTSADIFNTKHSALLFSLLYKSLKRDEDVDRVTSFVKRLLQLCCFMSPGQACGMLFLISQVLRDSGKKPAVRLVWTKREAEQVKPEPVEKHEDWLDIKPAVSEYRPTARNPSYAGGHCTAYVELLPLTCHFHPTVKLFAQKLIRDEVIHYSGDPIKDFAGIRFLDRFVFKNPKKRDGSNNNSDIKTVKGSHPKFAVRKNYSAKGIRSLRVNSSIYLNEDSNKIPVDEKFLYDFLRKRRDASDPVEDSDDESVTSEDFNAYLDSVTGAKAEESDDELDFMADMKMNKQQTPKDGGDDASDEGDDDDEDFDDDDAEDEGSDGALDISGDENEPDLSADEDELRLENDLDDDDDMMDVPVKNDKRSKMKLNLKGKEDLSSLFASAEEFSTILEETATNRKQGSSQAVSNTDKASVKQLAWEENRDRWIKGYNRKVMGKNHHHKRGDGNFHKRKAGNHKVQFANKKRKFK